MKKIMLSLIISLCSAVTFGAQNSTPSPATNNFTETLQKVLTLQQQENDLTNQLVQLKMQQNQLLQQFIQANNNATNNQYFKWVSMTSAQGPIPKDAINAGLTGGPAVPICHAAYFNLGVHPGTLTQKGCLISYAGKAYLENDFQILTGTQPIIWKDSSSLYQWTQPAPFVNFDTTQNMVIPQNSNVTSGGAPIVGGNEKGHPIYICRTILNNQIHVGKVVAGNCNIGFQGAELLQQNYEVLFAN